MNAVSRAKVDGRLGWLALAMPAVALVALLTAQSGNRLLWIPLGLVSLAAILVGWIFISTYYELRGEQLVAHCGPFIWHIALAEVTSVRASNSIRSGPALSMDRLEIIYGGGRVLVISPADKEGFVAALRQRAPGPVPGTAGPGSAP